MKPYRREFQVENRVVCLLESSGVMAMSPNGRVRTGPFLWLGVLGQAEEMTAHCSRAEVRRIRDALTKWLGSDD